MTRTKTSGTLPGRVRVSLAFLFSVLLLSACEQQEVDLSETSQDAATVSLEDRSTKSDDSDSISELSEQISAKIDAQPKRAVKDDRPHGAYDPHKALSADQHIKVALQHKVEGRMPLAIDTLTKALASNDKDFRLLAVRSSLFLESGQPSNALKDMNAALSLSPNEAGLLVNRAEVYRQFGRLDEAMADLDNAIAVNNTMVAAYFNRGTLHYQNGEHQLALKDFSRCIEINPHAAGPYFNRAAVLDVLGQQEQAIADIRHFMDLTENESWRKKAEELLQSWGSTPGLAEDEKNQDATGS